MDGSVTPHPETPALVRRKLTGADVLRMVETGILGEDERVELIGGELIEMGTQGAAHWSAVATLVSWLLRRLTAEVELASQGPLRLSEHDEPEPDLFLYPAGLDVNLVRGRDVLLVVEIADTSLAKDLGVKAALYAAHGAREYWIVDLNARLTLVHRLGEAGYGDPRALPFTQALPVAGVAKPLTLAALLGP